jgi:hypothetical protein
MFTTRAADVADAPKLSVAVARNVNDPAGALLHTRANGVAVSSPSFVISRKNETLVTLLRSSVVVALKVMVEP